MDKIIDTAVILAGGLGTRLRPFTLAIPKPLMPIGEVSLLERQINALKDAGITKIIVATNYKSEYLERFMGDGSHLGVEIIISKENEQLGTVGPLQIIENLPENFLIMNGDILTLERFSLMTKHHLDRGQILTVCIKEQLTPFNFGHVEIANSELVSIAEKPILRMNIVAGIYLANRSILSYIPSKGKFGMDELILKLLSLSIPISVYEIKNYWIDIGRLETLEEVQNIGDEHFES